MAPHTALADSPGWECMAPAQTARRIALAAPTDVNSLAPADTPAARKAGHRAADSPPVPPTRPAAVHSAGDTVRGLSAAGAILADRAALAHMARMARMARMATQAAEAAEDTEDTPAAQDRPAAAANSPAGEGSTPDQAAVARTVAAAARAVVVQTDSTRSCCLLLCQPLAFSCVVASPATIPPPLYASSLDAQEAKPMSPHAPNSPANAYAVTFGAARQCI